MIYSRQNQFIKYVRSLQNKKNRDAEGLYLVESVKLVNEAVALCGNFVKYVVMTENVVSQIAESDYEKVIVSNNVFDLITSEVNPQGVIAVVEKPSVNVDKPDGNAVFLDGVNDPANVGAIIRTAVCAGIKDIYICDGADAYSPKSVRASMGGIFRAKVHVGSRQEIIRALNCPLIVADMDGENYTRLKIKGNYCLIIGNEANGVSSECRQNATYTVSIPMQNGMESLNASVSAGILMYELQNANKGE